MRKNNRIYAKGKDHAMYKHGEACKHRSRLYSVWNHMIARCEYEKDINYSNYGGRGIKVCDEWHDSIKFIQWAKTNGYNDSLTIDRIDNNGDYEPLNCRFITLRENILRKPKKFLWGIYKTRCERWQVNVGKRLNGIDKLYYGGNYQCIALALLKRDELKQYLNTL